MQSPSAVHPRDLVIFGGTGDLAVRKLLPALYLRDRDGFDEGYREMKFFTAEASGGAAHLKAIQSPLPAARFCPTGGISPANLGCYLRNPNVGCVGGSWLTPDDVVARKDWAHISSLAAIAVEFAKDAFPR